MADLFFYGTLCHPALLDCVLGPERGGVTGEPAHLPGYAVQRVAGQDYPTITAQQGARAAGVLARGLTAAALARLDFYEGGHGYSLRPVTVETADGPRPAQVYFPDHVQTPGGDWRLSDWVADQGAVTLLAAQEVMMAFGQRPAAEVAHRFPQIRARAASRLRAATPGPTALRHRARDGDVTIRETRQPYAHYFAVEEFDLTHRRFDGTISAELSRAAFIAPDAATVLPYDPGRDRVLLIEQFRVGPMARGDSQPWLLEAIAGRVDAGETPEQTVRREAQEEAGLEIGALHRVHGYYPSPGSVSEYLYSFVGLADLPDSAAGLGGVPGEGEDIRAHVIGYERLMALLDAGELDNAPLLLSAFWLARNRDRLRAEA